MFDCIEEVKIEVKKCFIRKVICYGVNVFIGVDIEIIII